MNTFEELKEFIKSHLDDPDSLTKALIDLGILLYSHNQETAQAAVEEEATVVSLMDSHTPEEKKMLALEADSRAKVSTNGLYKLKTLEGEAIIEFINVCKVRINMLSWERKNS